MASYIEKGLQVESNDKGNREEGVHQAYRKDEIPDRYDTTSTCIPRQFNFEKTDKCNKHLDLSVHW